MIFIPLGTESLSCIQAFPAWCLGRNAHRQIIAASLQQRSCFRLRRNVRNIVGSPEFGQVFPDVSLAVDQCGGHRMNTNKGGAYVAAGVGTAITGRGADIALIDDPFKDREEATASAAAIWCGIGIDRRYSPVDAGARW